MMNRELIDKQFLINELKSRNEHINKIPAYVWASIEISQVAEQEIIKPYLERLATNVNYLKKVGAEGRVYVAINDVFDLIDNLLPKGEPG